MAMSLGTPSVIPANLANELGPGLEVRVHGHGLAGPIASQSAPPVALGDDTRTNG